MSVPSELSLPPPAVTFGLPNARAARRRRIVKVIPSLVFGVLGLVTLAAAAADLVPRSPTDIDLAARLTPPLASAQLLGTDALGRDLFSRLVHGARISVIVVGISVLLGGGIGTLLGVLAGHRRGQLEALIMRTTEISLGFPLIILAILLAAVYGPNLNNVIVILSLGMWAHFARIARAETISLEQKQFVTAARVIGASNLRIACVYFLPHLLNSLLVLGSLQAASAIQIEAGLSFFGAGVPPPAPSWGSMIADGRQYVLSAWWITVIPGLAIACVVLALNLLGDFLRDALDPTLRRR
jgi:peptide/nickel transport system permease protein